MICFVIIFLLFIIIPKTVIFLGIFQQNGYSSKKYLINLKTHYLKSISSYLEYISLGCLITYYINYYWYVMVLVLFFLIGSFMLTKQLVLIPKLTKRLTRLLIVFIIINLLFFIYIKYILLVLLIETILIPLTILISSFIVLPVEKKIIKYYYNKTKTKLLKYSMINIGITGSFGKTSTKNFLYHLIKDKYYTYKTPHSYNTPMGISKVVNNELLPVYEVFIAELGACNKGDIDELVSLVNIDIGVITEIGPQHLETFKSIDNVLKTKLEILNSKNLKTLVINQDNIHLQNIKYPDNIEVIRVGINSKDYYHADNIVLSNSYLSFDFCYKEEVLINIKTKLLGYHNIYNLLISIALAYKMGVSIKEIQEKCLTLEPVPHRLSTRVDGNINIIDDSFNSNLVGFKNAVDVLKLSNDYKVIITPGIVDGGKYLEELNTEVAFLLKEIDLVILVDNQSTTYIKNCLDKINYDKYIVVNSFKQAYNVAQKESKKRRITLLIENDLPDNYLRR